MSQWNNNLLLRKKGQDIRFVLREMCYTQEQLTCTLLSKCALWRIGGSQLIQLGLRRTSVGELHCSVLNVTISPETW